MIKLFKEVEQKFVSLVASGDLSSCVEKNMWLHITKPSVNEIEKISEITRIEKDVLISVLDDEESARLDVDDDYTLIVLDIPVDSDEDDDEIYQTYPVSLIYTNDYFITISKKNIDLVSMIQKKFKKIEPHKHVRLSLQIMYGIASKYIATLKVLDKVRDGLENALHTSMSNSDLLDLMALNKSLVYLSTSLNANKVVFSKVKRLKVFQQYEADFDLMEDAEVENNQAIEMCSIYRDILAGMIDANASIISNNLNTVMKVLAIITLVISIPTLVASLWGMNVRVPFNDNKAGFYIIIGISILCAFLGSIILFVYTSRVNTIKKGRLKRIKNNKK